MSSEKLALSSLLDKKRRATRSSRPTHLRTHRGAREALGPHISSLFEVLSIIIPYNYYFCQPCVKSRGFPHPPCKIRIKPKECRN